MSTMAENFFFVDFGVDDLEGGFEGIVGVGQSSGESGQGVESFHLGRVVVLIFF